MRKSLAAVIAAAVVASTVVLGGAAPADASTPKITMVIKSSTHSRADVDWYSDYNYATLSDHSTPYVKVVSTAGFVHSISASNYSDDSVSLTCVIKYRGKVVRQHTVHGSNVHVNCEFDK